VSLRPPLSCRVPCGPGFPYFLCPFLKSKAAVSVALAIPQPCKGQKAAAGRERLSVACGTGVLSDVSLHPAEAVAVAGLAWRGSGRRVSLCTAELGGLSRLHARQSSRYGGVDTTEARGTH
jgi:hypothetical protein